MRHRDVSNEPTACPGALDVERIIKAAEGQGVDVMDDNAGHNLYLTGLHREPEQPALSGQWNGKPPAEAIASLRDTTEWNEQNAKLDLTKSMSVDQLKAQLAVKPGSGSGGSYTDTDRAIDRETNSIVKQIWGKISSIFK
jgi:hypothetical protein